MNFLFLIYNKSKNKTFFQIFKMTFNASNNASNTKNFKNLPHDIINKIMTYNYQETPSYHFIKNKIHIFNKMKMNNSSLINNLVNNRNSNDMLFTSFPTITFKEWIFHELLIKKYAKNSRYFIFTDLDSDMGLETDPETDTETEIYDYDYDYDF